MSFNHATKEQIISWAKLGGDTSHARTEERKKIYYLNPKICKNCGTTISYEKRRTTFCSKRCAAIFNNLNCSKHPTGYKSKYETIGYEKSCDYCGKTVKRNRKIKKGSHVFCSHEHQHLYFTEQKIKNKQHVKPESLRHYIIATRGYRCEKCKLDIWMGNAIPLDMHHIDGDSKNNDLKNLKLFCKNCHGQTDNYGAKNIGNGTRKNYYRKKEIL